MDTFVIIFRQGARTLSDEELRRRTLETSTWARRQNAAGHKLDPHILGPEREVSEPEDDEATPAGSETITAVLFLEAYDLGEAAVVARSHPALSYGSSVEVRPWARPAPVAAST
jgi:hypothetical protein